MRIKRLEIYGFKSFPQRVILPFPPGISAIVGPNGSGKSNIVDALRWILGEQSPRLLRVREMTDLIFAGENGRRPEFAEVRLVLENEEGKGSGEWASQPEISITRRLYRDGESEFFINNRPCRLKDIIYLFLDTGVHARGYGIIDQGQVGQFVEQSPKERRRFLEELAGIARYKLKREETERQITRSRENLTRVKDILGEVERRLEELSSQAEKARTFLRLQEEIRDLELTRLNRLFLEAKARREETLEKVSRLREKVAALREEEKRLLPEKEEKQARLELLRPELQALEAALQEAEENLKKKEGALSELLREEVRVARELAQLEGQLSAQAERLKGVRQRLEEISRERKGAEEDIRRHTEELSRHREANQLLFEKKKEIEEELRRLKEEFLALKHAEEAIKREEERRRKEFKNQEDQQSCLIQEREILRRRLQELERKKKKLIEEKNHLLQEQKRREKEVLNLSAQLEEKERLFETLREETSLLRLKARELAEEVRWLRSLLSKSRSEAARVLKEAGLEFQLLFEAVQLEEEEEKLAEKAFPALLEAFWLPEPEVRKEALSLLQHKKLSALIFCGSDPSGFLRRRMLGLKWQEDLPPEPVGPVVTPQGLFLEADGLLHVPGEAAPALLSHRRELNTKERAWQKTRESLASREEDLKRLEAEIRLWRQKKEEYLKRTKGITIRVQKIEERLRSLSLEEEKLRQKSDLLREKEEELLRKRRETEEELRDLERELMVLRERKSRLEPRLKHLEDELRVREKEIKAALAKVRALELAVSAVKERLKQALKEQERLLKEESRLTRELERKRQDLQLIREERNQLREKLTCLRTELEEAKEEVSKRARELEASRQRYQRLEKEWQALLSQSEEIAVELARQQRRLHRLEVDLAELDLTLRHLGEQALERFSQELPLKQEPVQGPLAEIEDQLERKKKELGDFGPVNLAAIEELKKTQERRHFLLEQKTDLEKALADLEAAVQQINRTCRERLTQALKTANEKLTLVFPLLFPGGQAELRFTDSSDPLEAGLDLWVRLPGKPIRHLAMLSGGEKALTALAVLCAFYLVKPGPFCVLDEVDAPLDEANTERFNHLLEELVKHAQIILVTHNKRVMEVAHALFGVTMEEKGVSKIVSVRLT